MDSLSSLTKVNELEFVEKQPQLFSPNFTNNSNEPIASFQLSEPEIQHIFDNYCRADSKYDLRQILRIEFLADSKFHTCQIRRGFHFDAENGITLTAYNKANLFRSSSFAHAITARYTQIDNDFVNDDVESRRKRLILKSFDGLKNGDFCIAQLQAQFPKGLDDENLFSKIYCWDFMLDLLFEKARVTKACRILIPKPINIFWDGANEQGLDSRYMVTLKMYNRRKSKQAFRYWQYSNYSDPNFHVYIPLDNH